ncbi:antibiotic biosynthesis monooxygenase [Photobacterium sp. SDRW27]|uniref:putative quinol monooxygenase n=1 Tax=Photobacterium obscurum TaxID=2829490 RepID=UPI0022447349|nr:antibiotic biosynthesis monooxygenase [Photobacterium obscurum]MCW8328956.1 antibiotic biosynthesis monooxygenase [Photobacterium obscurum]
MFEQGLFITAELRVKPDYNLEQAIVAIEAFCQGMNSEPGCSMAVPLQDKSDPYRFIFWERYDSQEAFDRHFHEKHTQHFIQLGVTDLVQAFETQLVTQERK